MSLSVSDLWGCPPSLLWQVESRPVKHKKKAADKWPELRSDKLTLRLLKEIGDWSKSEPLPPVPVRVKEATSDVRPILGDLDAMLTEQNEEDFIHRPTEHAYNLARQTIENAYTHHLCSTPSPAIAPDGDGGLILEWKSGQHVVRLIVAASENKRSYVYSKGVDRSQIDYSTSGLILAQRLRSIFAD